jgi:sugar O-acyltransferase (sialic acid O-acetyltransferase NeuD family)
VYGAGGHAKTVLATIEVQGKYKAVGVLDDDESKHGKAFFGYQVLGGREQLALLRGQGVTRAIVAIGENAKRAEMAQLLRDHGFQLVRIIHPTATLLRGCRIGEGTVILTNARIGADAIINDNVIVSVGVNVSHDTVIGSCAQLAPGVCLAGGASIGAQAFLGMGAIVLPQVTVGRQTVVGANAVVNRDLPDCVTAVGVPARIVKERSEQT